MPRLFVDRTLFFGMGVNAKFIECLMEGLVTGRRMVFCSEFEGPLSRYCSWRFNRA
jgi:hypothetical protein